MVIDIHGHCMENGDSDIYINRKPRIHRLAIQTQNLFHFNGKRENLGVNTKHETL